MQNKLKIIIMMLSLNLLMTYSFAVSIESDVATKDQHGLIQDLSVVSGQISPHDHYIYNTSYAQNPYIGVMSAGGTQKKLTESQLESYNIAEKWFSGGTWNAIGEAGYILQDGGSNFGYGGSIFGQTGFVEGFSFGGMVTILNPVVITPYTGVNTTYSQLLPVATQSAIQELYTEYQYDNTVQADVGLIAIPNNPWMTFQQANALSVVTYSGASASVAPGGGWWIKGFAISGTELIGEEGFSQQTLYNHTFDFATANSNLLNNGSSGTLAIGADWASTNKLINTRIWDYQFFDYANLMYADTVLQLPVSNDLRFNIGAQVLNENAVGIDVFQNAGYGTVNSNGVGLNLGMNYDIFGLNLGYNNVWGPDSAYAGGGIVSPYTYMYATDPLYTTGFLQGLVERSAGSAYKISPSLSLLENNLNLSVNAIYFDTVAIAAASEYDFLASYSIPQVRGLNLYLDYSHLVQAPTNGGDFYLGKFVVRYIY